MTTVPEASSPRPGDALDALRAQLTCPLCRDVFTDPTTLPCNHTHCFECVARALGGKSWDASACPECAAPTVMKDLSVNMTLKSFVENFKSVDAELREALGAMRELGGTEAMDCDGDDGDDVGAGDRGGTLADGDVMEGDDAREREAKACEKLAETIRAIDATLAVIDKKLAVYKANDEALESHTQPRTQTQPGTQGTLDIESMTLSELRRLHRNVLGRSAASTRKKPWFVKELSQYDRDVMAAAMAATQPESPKVVVAYSSSALRCGGSQDEKFAEVERVIKSIDAGAVFMGMKDLTSECTHLIMDTGSKDRVVRKRTVKYVDAIARGLYVVHEDWLADCAERGSFSNEEAFELKDGTGTGSDGASHSFADGPRRARVCRETNQRRLFEGIRVRVQCCGDALPASALENILRLAGAIIEPASPKTPRRSSRRHSSAVRDHDAVPDSEDEADDSRETDSVVEDVAGDGEDEDDVVVTLVDDLTPRSTFKSISKPVNWKWALECVTRWELLPTLKWLKR